MCILDIVHLLWIALTWTHLVAHSLTGLSATSNVLWLTDLLLLVGHWFVIAILLLLSHVVLLLTCIRILTRLTLPLVVAASASTSSASVITTASASEVASSLILPIPLVVIVASWLLLAIHCLIAESLIALIHDKTDQLSETVVVSLIFLTLEVTFGLPKVHLDWFLVESKLS